MSKITNREVLSFFLGALVALLVFNVWIESAGRRESDSENQISLSYKEAAKHFAVPIPSGGYLAVSDNRGIGIIVVDPSKLSFHRDGKEMLLRSR